VCDGVVLQRRFDGKYGTSWHCIVGTDFKAAFSHESKNFIFLTIGKTNVLLYKAG
jgi:dynein light chain LC8-type